MRRCRSWNVLPVPHAASALSVCLTEMVQIELFAELTAGPIPWREMSRYGVFLKYLQLLEKTGR